MTDTSKISPPTVATVKVESFSDFPAWKDMPRVFVDSPGTVVVLLLLAITTIMKLRRKASRDSVEVVKDRAESDLIQNLTKDREVLIGDRDAALAEARTAWSKHNEVAIENARLQSQTHFQAQEIERLKLLVEDLRRSYNLELQRFEDERKRLEARFQEVLDRLQNLQSARNVE